MTRRDKALTHAIAFLRERGKYVLDQGTPAPKWGNHTDKPDMFDRTAAIMARGADRRMIPTGIAWSAGRRFL